MPGGNGSALTLADLREFRRQLAEASGKRKLDLLLSAPDPLVVVQALPEPELYLALLEIGLGDAADIVSLASPGQFQHFIDRASWPRADQGADSGSVLAWLTLARDSATSDQALQRYREKLANLDLELLELVLREQLVIHSLEDDPDPPVKDWGRTYRTPENKYVIEFVSDKADYGTLRQLLDDLFAQDGLTAMRLLESVRWEMPSELAEIARRWRDGRLRDLGFPQMEEALSFYARPAKRVQPAAAEATSTAALVPSPAGAPLLDRAFALVPADSLERAEESLVYAANAALVAEGIEPGDALAARATLQDARNTLSLGLELLSGGDAARAAVLLAERPVREIFQAAMGELYALQSRARRVSQAAVLPGVKSATLLEPPYAELISTLDRKRPSLPDPRSKGRTRAPATRAEIAAAEALLDEAAAIVPLLEALGASPTLLAEAAEKAGLTPSAVRTRDAILARARGVQNSDPGVSFGDLNESQKDTALAAKAAEILDDAAARIGTAAARRAAATLGKLLV